MRKRAALPLALIALVSCTTSNLIPPATLPAVDSSPEGMALVGAGVALHDLQKYDDALLKYEEALALNPSDTTALYEKAYTLSSMGRFQDSYDTARQAARYKSVHLPAIYDMMGSAIDKLGRSKEAIHIYQEGIRLAPQFFLLHFNLGVTYNGIGEPAKAQASLQESARLNPEHPGSQLRLGEVYMKQGKKVPAFLALNRFMIMEPRTGRSAQALTWIIQILNSYVTTDPEKENSFTVSVDPNAKGPEGDWSSMEFSLGIVAASRNLEENKGKSETQKILTEYDSFFTMLSEFRSSNQQRGFVWDYYGRYFSSLRESSFVEPMFYNAFYITTLEGVKEWVAANQAKMDEFQNWSNSYNWDNPEGN